jgi:hypothetical protein
VRWGDIINVRLGRAGLTKVAPLADETNGAHPTNINFISSVETTAKYYYYY